MAMIRISARGSLRSIIAETSNRQCLCTSLVTLHESGRPWSRQSVLSTVATSRRYASHESDTPSILSNLLNQNKQPWHGHRFMQNKSSHLKEEWLENLLSKSPERVDREAFLVVLRALSTSGEPDAPIRAERWILRFEKFHKDATAEKGPIEELAPNSECYQRVIEAWLNAPKEDPRVFVARADRWLHANPHVDTKCINAFLDLCTRGKGFKVANSLVAKHAQISEDILNTMIQASKEKGSHSVISPDIDSFNFVIRGWTRCRNKYDMTERTAHVLEMLEEYHRTVDASVCPDVKSYTMLLDALSVRAKQKLERCENWNDDSKNGMEELQTMKNIIDHMHASAEKGQTNTAPTTHTYNTLLSCWAHLAAAYDEAPFEAEKILRLMSRFDSEAIAPDSISYGIVMRVWRNSNHPNRAQRVAWWLRKLWIDYEVHHHENLMPTTAVYNTVIQTLCGAGEVAGAERVLSDLIRHKEENPDGKLGPDSESFALIMKGNLVLANKGSKDALRRAAHHLDVVLGHEKAETGIVASEDQFLMILGGCVRLAYHCPEVLDTAVETFDKLRQSRHSLSCLAFKRLLQTGLLALSHPQNNDVREAFVEELVKECRDAGLVGAPFIRALSDGRTFFTGYTYEDSERLLAQHFPDFPLPYSWTRNVEPPTSLPTEKDFIRTNFQQVSYHKDRP